MLIENIERIVRANWESPTNFKKSSVLLASFPKSGNTWFRFVASNVLVSEAKLKDPVNFHTIAKYSPEIRGNRSLKLGFFIDTCPTFLKTHFYATSYFKTYPCVVLYRNPEKALFSYYKYMINEHGKSYKSFNSFLSTPRVGLDYWRLFHASWLQSNAIFVSYDELIKDQVRGLQCIYKELGYEVSESSIIKSVEASSRENMAKCEANFGDPNKKNTNFKFVGLKENRHSLTKENQEILQPTFEKCSTIFEQLEKRKLEL